jgi:hypothetical protein
MEVLYEVRPLGSGRGHYPIELPNRQLDTNSVSVVVVNHAAFARMNVALGHPETAFKEQLK